jgi:hypothetical protein
MAATQVGWIGLGSMGIGMSKNLQKHLSKAGSPSLIYTNRTLSRGELLQELGAIPVETVKGVASKCDIIFSCVSERQHALDYMKWDSHMLHIRSVTMQYCKALPTRLLHPGTSRARCTLIALQFTQTRLKPSRTRYPLREQNLLQVKFLTTIILNLPQK